MTDTRNMTEPAPGALAAPLAKAGALDRFARSALYAKMDALARGRLTIVESSGRDVRHFGQASARFPHRATITVNDPSFFREVAFGGTVGSGEAYMRGLWDCDDLTALCQIMVLNADVMNGLERGLAWLSRPALRFFHWLNRNTRRGSKSNIAAHYDLGNDFYSLFLDPTMAYSAGWFERPDSTMEEASVAKFERLCQKLELRSDDHLLEIGCGWGGLAIHAAKTRGCRVTATTISARQAEWAERRVAEEGLQDRVSILRKDYRDLDGQYDKIVSVEMIEAVGWQFYGAFFRRCMDLLKEDGLLAMQAITIRDQRFDEARRDVDFIQRHIFPGSCIPSMTALLGAATASSDLRLFHHDDMTPHYARTLAIWRERCDERAAEIEALGFPESFRRMWEFYLRYCEGGFLERAISSVQVVMARPLHRGESTLGA